MEWLDRDVGTKRDAPRNMEWVPAAREQARRMGAEASAVVGGGGGR